MVHGVAELDTTKTTEHTHAQGKGLSELKMNGKGVGDGLGSVACCMQSIGLQRVRYD